MQHRVTVLLLLLVLVLGVGADWHRYQPQLAASSQSLPAVVPGEALNDNQLPPEVLESILKHLSVRDLVKASLVNKVFHTVAKSVQRRNPLMQEEICYRKLAYRLQRQPAKRISHELHFLEMQQNAEWIECLSARSKAFKPCDEHVMQLLPALSKRSLYSVFQNAIMTNWCELIVNEAYGWIEVLLLNGHPRYARGQADLLARVIEHLDDRDAAAKLHQTRLRVYAKRQDQLGLEHRHLAGRLFSMDFYVRYTDLAVGVAFKRLTDISEALSLHFFFRFIADLDKSKYDWHQHLLYRRSVPDTSKQSDFIQLMARASARYLVAPKTTLFSKKGSHHQKQRNAIVDQFVELGNPEQKFDFSHSPRDLIQYLYHPFHLVARYTNPETALAFYRTAYQGQKSLETIVFAGTSTHGTSLLESIFHDIIDSLAVKPNQQVDAFHGLSAYEGLTMMITACGLLHTEANWKVFDSMIRVFLETYPHRDMVLRLLTKFVKRFHARYMKWATARSMPLGQQQLLQLTRSFSRLPYLITPTPQQLGLAPLL